jgi:hypothetical protein
VPFDPRGTPDENFYNGEYLYLYRQVYSQDACNLQEGALPDGAYQLTDLNGTLPAVTTHASFDEGLGKVSYQETKVLDYTLTVSPTSRFDFMNFGAYMIGQVANGWHPRAPLLRELAGYLPADMDNIVQRLREAPDATIYLTSGRIGVQTVRIGNTFISDESASTDPGAVGLEDRGSP